MADAARRVSIDEKTNAQYDQAGISGDFNQNKNRFARDKTKNVQFDTAVEAANDQEHRIGQPKLEIHQGGRATTQPKRETVTLQNKKSAKKTGGDKVKAAAVNFSTMIWLAPAYGVQLTIALWNITFFVVYALTSEIFEGCEETDTNTCAEDKDGFITRAGKFIARTLVKAVAVVTGFDLGELAVEIAGQGFMVTLGLLMFYAMLVLTGVGMSYKSAGFKPLSGKNAGYKLSFFIVAIVGYITPGLNLFPWAIIWSFVIRRNPK